MQKKLRSAALRQIPVVLIVGENEEKSQTVSVRMRDGTDYGQVETENFLNVIKETAEARDDLILRRSLGT